jgi:hypothetical protein
MIEKAFHVRILHDYLEKQRVTQKQNIFNVFAYMVYEREKLEKKAKIFRFRHTVGMYFYAWSDWVHLVGTGLDRRRWKAARRYEVGRADMYCITYTYMVVDYAV